MGGFLGWDSFSQPWFVHDDEFGPISLMVHSSKSGQPMYESNLGSKVGLLGACIRSDLVWPWISHDGSSVLRLGLMGRPFSQYCVFPWNLACIPFDHDGWGFGMG